MCGIAGIFRFASARPVEAAELEAMAAALAHRGPDDQGIFRDGALGLANRRLTILDTSRRGRQPLFAADAPVGITYNGEIYNYLELRAELAQRGHRFRTATDTEVLLRLYLEYGESMLDRLNGIFAFALWDGRAGGGRRLFLARDRVGVKPLYYRLDTEGIVFASEIKAILQADPARPALNHEGFDAYMTVGYVAGSRTLFRGIDKLLPGWAMTVTADGPRQRQWWDLPLDPAPVRSEAELVEETRELLRDAVRLELRSDVPLGVFLSGGVDSSAVVAMMRELEVPEIRTFTVAYDFGPGFDETPHARRVAARFGTIHREVRVSPREFGEEIPAMVRRMEEPVTEAAAISLYCVARLARESVVVALSGEGADEVFGGYPIYGYMLALERYRRLPSALRRLAAPPLRRLGPKWNRYLRLAELELAERYPGVSFFDAGERDALYQPEMLRRLAPHRYARQIAELYRHSAGRHPLLRMMYLDIKTWLPDDLLIKADKMTMSTSIELRVPFLDHRLVELGARLPPGQRLRGLRTKPLLKRAVAPWLPPAIVERPKMGFPTPLARMFRGELRALLGDTLGSQRSLERGYFRPERVRQLLSEHLDGRADHHRVLWQLLVLEEWHRAFLD